MTQGTTLLDPTSEKAGGMRRPIAPPPSLDRLTVGFLDISKPQGDIFLDRLETLFGERQIKVKRFAKLTSAKQASEEVIADIAENCDVVVEALADWGSCTSCSLQDMLDIDRKGLPGVAIFSEEFRSGVEAWRDVHGFDANAVYVDHPIQPLTEAELHAHADGVFEEVMAAITAWPT